MLSCLRVAGRSFKGCIIFCVGAVFVGFAGCLLSLFINCFAVWLIGVLFRVLFLLMLVGVAFVFVDLLFG